MTVGKGSRLSRPHPGPAHLSQIVFGSIAIAHKDTSPTWLNVGTPG
jgi:hypothetical protein